MPSRIGFCIRINASLLLCEWVVWLPLYIYQSLEGDGFVKFCFVVDQCGMLMVGGGGLPQAALLCNGYYSF